MDYSGLTALLADYVAGREAKAKLGDTDTATINKFDKDADKQRKALKDNHEQLAALEQTLTAKRQQLVRPLINSWLTGAVKLAKQLQMVTHAIKFTHSGIRIEDSCSIYSPGGITQPEGVPYGALISTGSLNNPQRDLAGNAAVMNIANFLQLGHAGKTLLEYIEQGDLSPLRPFASSEEQLGEWLAGFRLVLEGNEASSHKYAKQLYFPVSGSEYHLLAPLYSSSLAYAVNSRIAASRYLDEVKEVRKAKSEGRYHAAPAVDFPDTAIRSFGGDRPLNVSQLNSSQRGKTFLLNSAPPQWERLAKPPLGSKTVFSRYHFGWCAGREVRQLKRYLELVPENRKNKKIRDCRAEYVEQIIDKLVLYVVEIHNLPVQSGWSAESECKLSSAEQLWLDPERRFTDEAFALELDKGDWQEEVADQFARWLNNRLKSDKLLMGDAEHAEWKKLAMEVID